MRIPLAWYWDSLNGKVLLKSNENLTKLCVFSEYTHQVSKVLQTDNQEPEQLKPDIHFSAPNNLLPYQSTKILFQCLVHPFTVWDNTDQEWGTVTSQETKIQDLVVRMTIRKNLPLLVIIITHVPKDLVSWPLWATCIANVKVSNLFTNLRRLHSTKTGPSFPVSMQWISLLLSVSKYMHGEDWCAYLAYQEYRSCQHCSQ